MAKPVIPFQWITVPIYNPPPPRQISSHIPNPQILIEWSFESIYNPLPPQTESFQICPSIRIRLNEHLSQYKTPHTRIGSDMAKPEFLFKWRYDPVYTPPYQFTYSIDCILNWMKHFSHYTTCRETLPDSIHICLCLKFQLHDHLSQ